MKYAREHRGEIRSARERARAEWTGAQAAGKPPDPMVMLNLDHLPIPVHMGADASFMIQQTIPLSGELGARVRRSEWSARALDQEARATALDVELDAGAAFLMVAEEQAMTAALGEQVALVTALEKVIEARLATATASPADLLRVQLERTRLEVNRDAVERNIRRSDAMLDAALGRRPDGRVPACALPDAAPALPEATKLARTALSERPELAAMGHRIKAAQEDVEVMRNMRAPMGVFGIGAAYTMADGFGLMTTVGLSIPIWAGEYDSAIEGAKAMVSMERAAESAMSIMIQGSVVAEHARLSAAQSTESAIRKKLLPKAEQVLQAQLSGYAGGSGSVVAVLESLQALQMVKMDLVGARAELGRAELALGRAAGTSAWRASKTPQDR